MNRQQTNQKEAKAVERFQMISELLKDDIDTAKMVQLKKKIAAENNLSVRTIERYCKAFREKGFSGLCPASKAGRTAGLPEGYDTLIQEAIALRREVPSRSVKLHQGYLKNLQFKRNWQRQDSVKNRWKSTDRTLKALHPEDSVNPIA
mgnify:CR=1 FL=1